MEQNILHEALIKTLRRTLVHLYDPVVLGKSVLLALLPANAQQDPVGALQRLLTDAIISLKPAASVPAAAPAWRIYHILFYRYVEQFAQREVANDLALSIRQLRRQESRALSVLADRLWMHYNLDARPDLLAALREQASTADEPEPEAEASEVAADLPNDDDLAEASLNHAQELAWLSSSLTGGQSDLGEVLAGVLQTLTPLLSAHPITTALPPDLPPLAVSPVGMRQVLLNLIAAAVRLTDGSVSIEGIIVADQLHLSIRASTNVIADKETGARLAESLAMAAQLMQLSGGALQVVSSAPFDVELLLPTITQLPILAVDDNLDSLQLLARYLAGSPYRLISLFDPQQLLATVLQTTPAAIVLDVMMPGLDGWEVLARLREHPQTSAIPVIISTILPEQELASLLGAADFLQKPVTRERLLATLARHVQTPPA